VREKRKKRGDGRGEMEIRAESREDRERLYALPNTERGRESER
jgi:hypothetical protein